MTEINSSNREREQNIVTKKKRQRTNDRYRGIKRYREWKIKKERSRD